uniref:Uncharacterized protein n=1 Tax=Nothoprocta perdicaria TaxID=30464 RepID=A0A8C6ZG20_NOTPE
MELWQVPLLFSRLSMFPFFDLAHYVASVVALKEQKGGVDWVRAMTCWVTLLLLKTTFFTMNLESCW